MATIFVLGPSSWRNPKTGLTTPLTVRRRIALRLENAGHRPILLESVEDHPDDEDLLDKFDRVLDTQDVTDVLVYHPPFAKMQATLHELILLVARSKQRPVPQVWLVIHEDAAQLAGFRFELKERGLGSRYLDAIFRLRPVILTWRTSARLMDHVDHIAQETAKDAYG